MGHSVIPRDVACCEVTVNLPSCPAATTSNGDLRDSVFVVNDLAQHAVFRDRPYVTESPHGRFYAGVPITTPSGVNIGAYCILDDKPRDTVSDQDLVFMRDMSQTIMTHLETIRALSEREQSNDMVAGLGQFIRDPPESRRETSLPTNMPLKDGAVGTSSLSGVHRGIPDALVDAIASPVLISSHLKRTDYFDQNAVGSQQSQTPGTADSAATTPRQEVHFQESDLPQKSSQDAGSEGPHSRSGQNLESKASTAAAALRQKGSRRPPLVRRATKDKTRSAYQRAAEILCQSMRLDGVAFLDASVSTFGGLYETTETSTGAESDDSTSLPSDSTPHGAHKTDTKACKVLGCAQANNRAPAADSSQPAMKLTEYFIRRLMRRNPRGNVWTFDEDFFAHSEDGFSTDNEAGPSSEPIDPRSKAKQMRKSARQERRSDGESLQLAFPGARCIALHGIWDHLRRRWSGAGLFWTYDPLRVLCAETEMRFVATYCDVIVAETRRLEVVDSDKAKSDFMSSVSHELRSPLHGILGSVEILADQELGNTASMMVEQITSCGRTLLDIIDHLLDFADLKQHQLKKGAVKSSKICRMLAPNVRGVDHTDLSALNTDVALDSMTEDVVVSSVYSYHYNHETEDRSRILVILDIERSADASWRCQLATGGWKRICVNLITNALKYTPAGYVRVSLKRVPRPGARRRFDALLCVSDSGKGMSAEFQRNHLFRDFSQEDTLSSGLGIGLHMVSRIVDAMGGKIDVASSQNGTGTRVTVTLPLEQHSDRGISAQKKSADVSEYKLFTGLEASLVIEDRGLTETRNDDLRASAWAMAIASIRNDCEFLGVQLKQCSGGHDVSCDLKIIMEADLQSCTRDMHGSIERPPMLVVCSNYSTAQRLRDSWTQNDLASEFAIEFIALPCGIKQMAGAISGVLRLHKERKLSVAAESQNSYVFKALRSSIEDMTLREPQSQHASIIPSLPEWSGQTRHEISEFMVNPLPSTDTQQAAEQHAFTKEIALSNLQASVLQDLSGHHALLDTTRSHGYYLPDLPPQTRPNLLLVDDNSINLKLLTAFAKKRRYPNITAVNGQLAVNAFVDTHRACLLSSGEASLGMPNVILMDINMPVMDGYEAVQLIRTYEKNHRLTPATVIAVTALDSEAAHIEAFGSGFNMFLSKPLRLEVLTQIIEAQFA